MKQIRHKVRHTLLFRALQLLPRSDKLKLTFVVSIQILLGLLDILAVALIGILTSISVNGIQSKDTKPTYLDAIDFISLNDFSFQTRVALLGATAAFLMILRTLISIYLNRKTIFFLSRRSASVSSSLVRKVLGMNLLSIQKNSSQEVVYAVTAGVSSITLGIIGSTVALVADVSLLLIMSIGLFSYNPLMAFLTALIFGSIGVALYLLMHVRIKRLGEQNASLSITSNQQVVQAISNYREVFVRNRRSHYVQKFSSVRHQLANVSAEMAFMPNISKYVLEIALVVGAITIAASQFLTRDAVSAVSSMTVFLAASTRIAPAILRVQQGLLGIKASVGSARPTLDMVETLALATDLPQDSDVIDPQHLGFNPTIVCDNVSFAYGQEPILESVSFSISAGEKVALVGKSGAGKSTLMDLLLGVLDCSSGKIMISGMSPLDAICKFQGAIAYVPQDISLTEDTIAENVRLGFSEKVISDALVWEALEAAELGEFVHSLPDKLQYKVGENGSKLSGGQRQRLGIARALVTKPLLVFMDEATSALDSETEKKVAATISKLGDAVTVVMIAHRESTAETSNRRLRVSLSSVDQL
jgi:ABC-type multidrug transport system fused ATPase/permease subunit